MSIGDTNEDDDDDDDDDDDGASGSSKAKAAAATAAAIAASFATVESSDAVHLGGSARAASTCATSSASALPSNFAAAFAIAPDDAAAAAAAATAAAAPPTSSAASGALFARAKAAKEAGNMHEAIELYGQAFAAGHPRGDQCLLMAATCYAKLGGHSEALALYDASLQRLPQRLAWQQRQQQDGDGIGKGGGGGGGRGGEAQAILRLQDLRAESLEALGRLEDAMAAMRLASAIEPSSRRAKELGRLQALSVDATASAATANGAEVGTSDAAYGGRSSGASGVAMAALERERQWRPAPLPHEPPLAPFGCSEGAPARARRSFSTPWPTSASRSLTSRGWLSTWGVPLAASARRDHSRVTRCLRTLWDCAGASRPVAPVVGRARGAARRLVPQCRCACSSS